MSTYALIENGIVTNTILWDGPDVAPINWPEGTTAVQYDPAEKVEIGYTYDSKTNKFSAPDESAT